VWATLVINQATPCPNYGVGCRNAETSKVQAVPNRTGIDFDLGISNCTNDQTPCPDPCP
jgi:hypothetical protein